MQCLANSHPCRINHRHDTIFYYFWYLLCNHHRSGTKKLRKKQVYTMLKTLASLRLVCSISQLHQICLLHIWWTAKLRLLSSKDWSWFDCITLVLQPSLFRILPLCPLGTWLFSFQTIGTWNLWIFTNFRIYWLEVQLRVLIGFVFPFTSALVIHTFKCISWTLLLWYIFTSAI